MVGQLEFRKQQFDGYCTHIGLQPFHLQGVKVLAADAHPKHVMFCQWFMQRTTVDPSCPKYVLFTNEANFTRDSVFNTHNLHVWAHQNPHGTRSAAVQQRFAVNEWTGLSVIVCCARIYYHPILTVQSTRHVFRLCYRIF